MLSLYVCASPLPIMNNRCSLSVSSTVWPDWRGALMGAVDLFNEKTLLISISWGVVLRRSKLVLQTKRSCSSKTIPNKRSGAAHTKPSVNAIRTRRHLTGMQHAVRTAPSVLAASACVCSMRSLLTKKTKRDKQSRLISMVVIELVAVRAKSCIRKAC